MPFPELYGQLVHLRPPVPADYPHFQKILSDPVTMDQLYFLSHIDDGGWTPEQIAKRYDERREAQTKGVWVNFAICDAATGTLMGDCAIKNINPANRHAEFGVILHHPYWGKGYARECLVLCLDYAFDHLKLHRIEMDTAVTNTRSRKMLERLGLQPEGIRKERLYSGGAFADDVIYAILASDWPRIREII